MEGKAAVLLVKKLTFLFVISICFTGRQASITYSRTLFFATTHKKECSEKKGSNRNIAVNQLYVVYST
jgi:hypothetical protein